MESDVVGMTVGLAGRSTVLLVGDDIVNTSTLSTSSFSSMYQQMVINTRIVPAGGQRACVISCIMKSCDNLLVSTSYTRAQKLIAKHFSVRVIIVRVRWALAES